jgi:hypothetical protein
MLVSEDFQDTVLLVELSGSTTALIDQLCVVLEPDSVGLFYITNVSTAASSLRVRKKT